ncbi:MAG: glycosyltransferase family 2 protein [Cytophagales bacterium]|nr:glycosyltransferase family 2 protein [Cytophagales bacterium]
MKKTVIKVIIPAYNEEQSISNVIRDIPKDWVSEVIVVNNNSLDATEEVARKAGATVLTEKRMGYGFACLKGLEYLRLSEEKPNIVVFIDGDYSDYPEELPNLAKLIIEQDMDLVIGSRALGKREKGSMTIPQVFGNWLATNLIRIFYKVSFTDLGPFRAMKYDKLEALNMKDETYGWTVEMQVKAAKKGYKCTEIPVTYRQRIGVSKVSGTVKGTILAGYKILGTIFTELFRK